MAEETTTTTEPQVFFNVDGKRYPFIPDIELTGRQIGLIEDTCGESLEVAIGANKHIVTAAYAAVCVCAAKPGSDYHETLNQILDLPSAKVFFERVETAEEAGPTKPARTRAKSDAPGSQK